MCCPDAASTLQEPRNAGHPAVERRKNAARGAIQRAENLRGSGTVGVRQTSNYCRLSFISPCLLKLIRSTFSCPLANSPATVADWSEMAPPEVTCTRRRCFPGDTCMAWNSTSGRVPPCPGPVPAGRTYPAPMKVARASSPTVSPATSPATLEIEVEHKFAEANLSIWVDDRLTYTHRFGRDRQEASGRVPPCPGP